jgi:cell division protein FtsQ
MVARHSPIIDAKTPGLMQTVTTVFIGIMVIVVMLGIVKASSIWMPVRNILLEGKFQYASTQQIRNRLDQLADGGFLTIDLMKIQTDLRQLPWIKTVEIERIWPDGLRVYITEKTPYLRLGSDRMVSVDGVVFTPASVQQFSNIPLISIDQKFTPELFRSYRKMEYLLTQNGYELQQLHVTRHGEWSLHLSDEVNIKIGAIQPLKMFERFIAMLPSIESERAKHIKSVDLRYENGIAIEFIDS